MVSNKSKIISAISLASALIFQGCNTTNTNRNLVWALHETQHPWQAAAFRDKKLRYIPDRINYGMDNHWATAKEVIENGGGDSADICGLMEFLLYDTRYKPELIYIKRRIIPGENLSLQETDGTFVYRVLCTYSSSGKFACLGATPKEDRSARDSIEDLVNSFNNGEEKWEFVSKIK